VRHTVTADDGTFDLGLDGEGSGGSHRFTEPGAHAYHCSVHPSMTGTVVVD
jgi:plastocyanin